MADPKRTLYSIGHSTRSAEEVIAILRGVAVTHVVDIRRFPRSCANPQFNRDVLPATLARADIAYVQIAELGGRRSKTGRPWSDASGARLRTWMGIDITRFHDPTQVAIIPMGYCYPGRGSRGDAPPRPECAPLWLDRLLAELPERSLTLLIGQYALRHFLGARKKASLTETVRAWRQYGPAYLPMPHPSPRNQLWLKRHPWFEDELVPVLRARVRQALAR